MLRGLTSSAQGMQAQIEAQDVASNNLANVSTSGFEREVVAFRSARDTKAATTGQDAQSTLLTVANVDSSPGALRPTGSLTDVAVRGDAFLVASTPQGNLLFRGGTLHTDAKGILCTSDGNPVLDSNGKQISVGSKDWTIAKDGSIASQTGSVGKLQVVTATGPRARVGHSFVSAASSPVAAGSADVLQGFIEQSNVQPVQEMVSMISGVRAYESNQKAVQSQDQTLQDLFEILHQ